MSERLTNAHSLAQRKIGNHQPSAMNLDMYDIWYLMELTSSGTRLGNLGRCPFNVKQHCLVSWAFCLVSGRFFVAVSAWQTPWSAQPLYMFSEKEEGKQREIKARETLDKIVSRIPCNASQLWCILRAQSNGSEMKLLLVVFRLLQRPPVQ